MGGTALERLLSDPSAALWDPLPRDLVAELTYYVWSAEHPAPEAVAYLWCWRQARDGRRPSIRDLAEFAGRGKTWAARLRQRVLVDFDSWTDGGRLAVLNGTLAGHSRDTRGTDEGPIIDIVAAGRDSRGTAAGQPRDSSRARDPLPTITITELVPSGTLSNSDSSTSCDPSARPTWASTLKLPKAVNRSAFVAVVLKASEALKQKPINPERCSGAARQVRILWESVGSPPLDELERLAVLLAEAAHRCPAPEFAREIRAEGWVDGTNRATFSGNVWRTRPPQNSGGADTERRIEVAEAWHEAGRPEHDWPPQKPNKGHNGRKPAHRHAIAGREYPFEVVELPDGRREARRYRHTVTPDCELWGIREKFILETEVVSG